MRPLALLLTLPPLLCLLGSPPACAGEEEVQGFEQVIEGAKRRVYPALVFVKPVQEDLSEGKARRVEVLGSGVIFRPDGHVVTNHHVAEKAREIRCVLGDRRQVRARVVGLDRLTDLAVLRLDLAPGETVPHADLAAGGALEEGQFVLALGSPYGFERSISLGIVSNARRSLEGEVHLYNNWIQTDAAINPGNSGGPLVNTRGEVIGINTLAMRAANDMGFAIPVEIVRRVVGRLLAEGRVRRSRHGLTLRALVDYMQNTVFEGDEGVIVDDVAGGSPAETAGLRKGDRILVVAGRAVAGTYKEDLPEIRWMLADLPPDEPAVLRVRRGLEEMEVVLVPEADDDGDGEGCACERWDVTFQRIHPDETPALHFWKPRGVYVLGVSYPGNAASSGLRPEDIVLRVDGQPVEDLGTLRQVYERVLAEARPRRRVLFEVLRGGFRSYVALDYERDFDPHR